jgi:hypothetical protein
MNPKEKKELALSKLLLVLFAAIGLLAVVWLAWIRPSPQLAINSSPEAAVVTDQQQAARPKAATLTAQTPEHQYLTISEWSVRAPLTNETLDLVYTHTKSEAVESVTFTFKRLQDAGICSPSAGVTATRSMTQNQPPYDPVNPAPTTKVGDYYYYLAYAGEPCTMRATEAQQQVARTINGGDVNAAVSSVVQKFEPAL